PEPAPGGLVETGQRAACVRDWHEGVQDHSICNFPGAVKGARTGHAEVYRHRAQRPHLRHEPLQPAEAPFIRDPRRLAPGCTDRAAERPQTADWMVEAVALLAERVGRARPQP